MLRVSLERAAARLGAVAALMLVIACAGCGSAARRPAAATSPLPSELVAEARPIGAGAQFHPAASGPVVGPCLPALGTRAGVHVELFAQNRVVLIASGIGTRPPRRWFAGRIAAARCYGDVVTLEPTGVVLVRPQTGRTVADLFRAWGQPLSARRVASFAVTPGGTVSAFVDGRRWTGAPAGIPLTRHAEIVLEVGPYVPPHRSYTFPPGS